MKNHKLAGSKIYHVLSVVTLLSTGCATWWSTSPPEIYEIQARKYACKLDYANAEKYYGLSLEAVTRDYFQCTTFQAPTPKELYSYSSGVGKDETKHTVYEMPDESEVEAHSHYCTNKRANDQSKAYEERAYLRLLTGDLKGSRKDAQEAIALGDSTMAHVVMAWLYYFDHDSAGVSREAEVVRHRDALTAKMMGLDGLADDLKSNNNMHLKPPRLSCDPTSPIVVAVLSGDVTAAETLLNNGAPVNTKIDLVLAEDPSVGWIGIEVPLIFAPVYNGDMNMLRMLLKHGADVNSRSNMSDAPASLNNANYFTLIGYAVARGREPREPVVRLLLDHGADPNASGMLNNEATTPLWAALQTRNATVAKLLLERGAKRNTPPVQGKTLLQMARTYLDYSEMKDKPAWQEIVRQLSQ
jgi:hypothetical protein